MCALSVASHSYGIIEILVIPLLIAVVTSILTVTLAFRRFRAEKWWVRKADAYGTIIDSLYVMKRGLQADLAWYRNPDRTQNKDSEREFEKKCQDAWDAVLKAIDTGSFLLSEESATALLEFKQASDKADADATHDFGDSSHFDAYSALNDTIDAIDTCLKKLPALARSDLKIS